MVQANKLNPIFEAVIMLGGLGENHAETLMRKALEAAATDLAQLCHQSDKFAKITILADSHIKTLDDKILSL